MVPHSPGRLPRPSCPTFALLHLLLSTPHLQGTGGGRGVALAGLVNDGAKRARVRVEGRVNGQTFAVERTANRK